MVRIAALLLSLMTTACAGEEQPPATAEAAPATSGAPAAEMAADEVLATYEGGQVTWGDLQEDVDMTLRRLEMEYLMNRYDTMSQALDAAVTERLLEAEADKGGYADVDALLKVEIEDKVDPPTDTEVASFYMMVQRQLGGATMAEARPMLEQELVRRAQIERYRAYVGELRDKAGVETKLAYPDLPRVEVPIGDNDPMKGPADAPITIVQFAEYQCPYCQRVGPTLDRLMADYEGKVRLVFKDYPLPNHSRAMPAAIAAHCAGDQGKYWEMNHTLLSNQRALEDDDLARYAEEIGLDVGTWQSCIGSGKYEPIVQSDVDEGQKAGVSATPSFFINGIFLAGAQPYEQFAKLVEQELANN